MAAGVAQSPARFNLFVLAPQSIVADSAAGLEGLSAHRLRESAAVRLAEQSYNDHDIMAMSGRDMLKERSR